MSSNKVKQQVRPEQSVKLINKLAKGLGGKSSKATGLVPFYVTAALPNAAHVEDGCLAFDTTVNKLKISKAGSWVLAN